MLCAENWGDGIGTSKRQMGNITELGIIFAGTGIKSFKELSLSKIESLTNEFTGCSQLSSIAFPETLRIYIWWVIQMLFLPLITSLRL